MAIALSPPEPSSSPFASVTVRVGAALWIVSLSGAAAASLRSSFAPSGTGGAELDLDRTMESMRRKAMELRMFGGGAIWLDGPDVAPPFEPLTDGEGREIKAPVWYAVIDKHTIAQP